MELYDNPFSPYAFKLRAALYEKAVRFEKREIRKHADRETLLRLNPRGEVPALVDDGAVICDSKVICAYLEDRFPDPALCPHDPVQRAHCRALDFASGASAPSRFDRKRLHWRNDRLEFAVRVGLGPWLLSELAADRAFLSPIP